MATIASIISDYSPSEGSVGVPLGEDIVVTFDRLMDEDELEIEFFIAGPDTDTFIGPGVSDIVLYPDSISQGDDLLASPTYTGIVAGSFSFDDSSGYTVMTFSPTRPMTALTEYTAHLPTATDAEGTEYTGHVTFSWTTGSGSIEALPDTASTSVLTSLHSSLTEQTDLAIVSSNPVDQSVQNEVTLSRITIKMNKNISPSSVNSQSVLVKGYAASEHPNLSVTVNENIAKNLSVEGDTILIDI